MNRSLLLRLLFVFVVCCVPRAYSQDFPMLHFTNDDGLPGNTVHQVYRDHKGFLWFATDKGVARYNGLTFEVFTTFNGLPNNEVFMFCEDLHARLWLVSYNGELCYFKDNVFHTARNTPLLRLPFQVQGIKSIIRQSDSSVIVDLKNSTRFLNITAGKCHIIDARRIENKGTFGALIYRKKIARNRYKFIFTNNIVIVDTLMKEKQRFDVDTFRSEAGGNQQFYSSCQNQDYLFNKEYVYTTDQKYMATFPTDFHKNNYLNQIFFNLSYRFYATNNGLFINDTIHILKEYGVSSVSTDRYGNYWISTLNNGVFVLKSNFMDTKLHKDYYKGQVVYSYGYKGQLFFATASNSVYHLENNTLSCLVNYADAGNEKQRPNTTRLHLIDSNYSYYSIVNHDYLFKINIFDKKSEVSNIDVGNDAKSLYSLNGYFYVQKPDAIIRFRNDPTVDKAHKYYSIGVSARDDRITGIAKDNANALWYATTKGMYKITDTGTITAPGLFRNTALKSFVFLEDDLIGYTNSNQLLVFKNISGKIMVDTNVLENCIWDKLYKIDNEHILISTNNLYRLLTVRQKEGRRIYYLSVIDDAFIPLEPDAVVSDGNVVYFMKSGVITSFRKECLFAKPAPPKLFFTEVRSGNNIYFIEEELKIPFGDAKNMTISFATVSFPGSNVTYQYSISKSSKEFWTDIKGEDINIVNSNSGRYTVKIRAKTTTSDYCTPVAFTLRIARPFWVRWWFILLVVAAVIYIIAFIGRQRLTYILNRKDKEHDMKVRFMKSEYKALNALMNPHFIFNTLNNVQGLINKNDKLAANEYLRVIADLIRQNMHNISKELIPLQKEIDLVSNYLLLEKLRFKDKLNYTIIVDKDIDLTEILIPPLLIQPLVENSIKHGILRLESKEGSIFVNIFERKGSLVIEVKDNGVGLNYKKSEKLSSHESFGLENIRKRIEQLSIIQSKEISFDIKERRNETGNSKWTVATIIIPLDA